MRPLRCLLLPAAAVAIFVVATAAPAWGHGHAETSGHSSPVAYGELAGGVLVASTVILAGLVFAPLVAGPVIRPGRRWRVVLTAGAAGIAADLATLAWPSLAGATFEGWTARAALAHLLVTAAVVIVARRARPLPLAAAAAALLAVLALNEDHDGSLHTIVAAVHLFAATVWAGGVIHLALGWSRSHAALVRSGARRFGVTAAVAALVTVSSAVAATHLHVPRSVDLLATGYGRLVVVEIFFATAIIVMAAVARRGATRLGRRRASSLAVEAGLIGSAVVVGAALSVLSPPGPLVQLAELDRVPATSDCTSRHLGHLAGLLAAEDDRPGRYRLEPVALSPRTGSSGCGLVGGSALQADPGAVGSAYGSFLDSLGVRRTTAFTDGTPGSRELSAALAAASTQPRSRVSVIDGWQPGRPYPSGGDAVVIATDAERAASVMSAVVSSESRPARGVFLAPWLLDAPLLAPALSDSGVQVSLGLPFDPNSNAAVGYIEELGRVDDDAAPTGSGLEGYLEALAAAEGRKVPRPTAICFYTPSQANFLPASLSEGHAGHGSASWIPGNPNANLLPESGVIALRTGQGYPRLDGSAEHPHRPPQLLELRRPTRRQAAHDRGQQPHQAAHPLGMLRPPRPARLLKGVSGAP